MNYQVKVFGFVLTLFLVAGCGDYVSQPDYSGLGLVDISGTVTLDGKPVSGAAVYFHDRENRRYSWGMTNAQGKYRLMLDSRKSGVMPGLKEVEITTTKNPAASPADGGGEGFVEGQDDAAPRATGEQIPAKYNSATTLTYEVTTPSDEVNFVLTSN